MDWPKENEQEEGNAPGLVVSNVDQQRFSAARFPAPHNPSANGTCHHTTPCGVEGVL